ncbi:Zn-ribbon domain-containing OB-fold protein [Nocardia sp. NPDC051750]|uniref:Zn-ribbon domain-containing OB-fold protein n=1 Tax=Nocardia sp. NPDC051750 TaxID=3364325 RepID=UPI00378AC836
MYSPDPESTGGISDEHAQRMTGTLMIRRCARCDRLFAPLTVDCSSCASDSLEWVPSSGAGTILSWRVVDRGVVGGRDGPMPLTIAIVELDEGPWVYSSIEGDVPLLPGRPALLPGSPVRVRFQPCPREDRFPVFTVDTDSGGSGYRHITVHGIGDRSGENYVRD